MIETNIDFPAGLPNGLRADHQANHVQPFQRTTMADGRARQRRRFSSVPSMQAFTWIFKANEAALFEAWFRDAIKDGAEWFNIKRLTPLGMSVLVCRFSSMYRGPVLLGVDRWQFSAELEVWERPLMPVGWGEFPEFVLGASIIDIALNREWPEA